MLTGKLQAALVSLIGATLAAGITALLDWACALFWPTVITLLVFSGIGCFITGFSLIQNLEHENAKWTGSLLGWCVLFAFFVFGVWERHSLSPVWYALCWGAVVGVASQVGELLDEGFMRKHVSSSVCPRCGAIMRYAGEEYAGSTDSVGPSGSGTRTAHYQSVRKCAKCGYEKRS